MKVCTEQPETPPTLTYRHLKPGEIFRFTSDKSPIPDSLRMKASDGYISVVHGQYWRTASYKGELVTRYPNACITLGEPE